MILVHKSATSKCGDIKLNGIPLVRSHCLLRLMKIELPWEAILCGVGICETALRELLLDVGRHCVSFDV